MQKTRLIWLSDEAQWRVAKAFYAHHQGGRPLRKERIAVLCDAQGKWLACARLRNIGKHQLLVGVLVDTQNRGQGMASCLLQQLAETLQHRDSYLFCVPALVDLYQRHDFVCCADPVADIAQLLIRYRRNQDLICMRYRRN